MRGGAPPPPTLRLVIAHDYGCIRALKWYRMSPNPAPSDEEMSSDERMMDDKLLGVISLACSDGCIRLIT